MISIYHLIMKLNKPICARKICSKSSVMFKIIGTDKYKPNQKIFFKGFYRVVIKVGMFKDKKVIFCSKPFFKKNGGF